MYRPFGQYPKAVYRSFTKPEYLEDFLEHGRFRIGHIDSFRSIEDSARRDQSEGEARYRRPGIVTKVHFSRCSDETFETNEPGDIETSAQIGNPTYLFCTSRTSIDLNLMRSKFGDFVALISEPRRLALDLCHYFQTSEYKLAGGIEGCCVQYTKDTVIQTKLSSIQRAQLSYSQKPEEHKKEKEFRYVAILFSKPQDGEFPTYLEIDLNKKLTYASRI